jgi:CheY-like chemotaxis protein
MARILVVDDEPLIAMSVSDWLSDLGHLTTGPAADLATALALVEEPIDAAILDVTLGAQTSAPVAKRLTERGIPFALASGHDIKNVDSTFASGIALPKPFGFETFRVVVERLLNGA